MGASPSTLSFWVAASSVKHANLRELCRNPPVGSALGLIAVEANEIAPLKLGVQRAPIPARRFVGRDRHGLYRRELGVVVNGRLKLACRLRRMRRGLASSPTLGLVVDPRATSNLSAATGCGDEARMGGAVSGELCNAPRRIQARSPPTLELASEVFTKTTEPSSSSCAWLRIAGC